MTIFSEVGVKLGYAGGKLKPGTQVYSLLGFSGPLDPRGDTITMQQLLDHTGGYDDSSPDLSFDPTYNMRGIALELGLTHPVTKLDVVRYMYRRWLDFTPGTEAKYSNYGYLLAGAVVEHVTGLSYFEYLKERLLLPAGISEVKIMSTLPSGRNLEEAIAEDQGQGVSPIDLHSELRLHS